LFLNDYPNEFNAYEHLGMMYFHLNDLPKARFFHNRMINGITEDPKSGLRKLKVSKNINPNEEIKKKVNKMKHTTDKFFGSDESDASDDSVKDLANNFFSGGAFLEESAKVVTKKNRRKDQNQQENMVMSLPKLKKYSRTQKLKVLNNRPVGHIIINKSEDSVGFNEVKFTRIVDDSVNMSKAGFYHMSTNRSINIFDGKCVMRYPFKHYRCEKFGHYLKNGGIHKVANFFKDLMEEMSKAVKYIKYLRIYQENQIEN